MRLKFTKRLVYGRALFFPADELTQRLLDVFPQLKAPRKSLSQGQISKLLKAGFLVDYRESAT